MDRASLGATHIRSRGPRFLGDAGRADEAITETVCGVASGFGVTPAQVALARVSAQCPRLGIAVVPIPGTKSVRWFEENVGALEMTLDAEALTELDPLGEHVVGSR